MERNLKKKDKKEKNKLKKLTKTTKNHEDSNKVKNTTYSAEDMDDTFVLEALEDESVIFKTAPKEEGVSTTTCCEFNICTAPN